jgi:hypothetical protein
MVDIVMGTFDVTGAAINVCLGFIPDKVELWNMEDANNREPKIEWVKEMAVVAQMDEGIKEHGISDTDFDRTVMAANGISAYSGGDEIIYDGITNNRWESVGADGAPSGTSKEEVYVDGHYKRTSNSDDAYRCYGDRVEPNKTNHVKVKTVAGFTLGADTELNADGEQICFIAYRCN